jgi:DNA-binding MarR family transcriptional regulator
MKTLIDIVSKLSVLISQSEEAAKEQFHLLNLTHSQMHYLETIHILHNPNITELSKSLKLTKPTVTVAIDKLIEKDFIYKIQSDKDRRSAHLHLTEKGKLINQMHDYSHSRVAESIMRKLNSEELETLTKLLSKVLLLNNT